MQHLHPRQPQLVAQRPHVVGDQPQVLRDDRQGAEFGAHRLEEPRARPGDPAPVDRRPLARRDLPVVLEAAEVVDPREVVERQRQPQPRDPPAVAVARHHVPAVERVAPVLAGRAEVVRRHPRDDRGPVGLVQGEEVRVGPDVGAVVGDEDRQIADDADLPLARRPAHRLPVAEEAVLAEALERDRGGLLLARRGQRPRLPRGERRRPGVPGRVAVRGAQRPVERVVVEPAGVLGAERPVVVPRPEAPEGAAQQSRLEGVDRLVVDPPRRPHRRVRQVRRFEQAVRQQPVGADQQRIPGERRERLVGRVAVAGRPERQHLPEPLPRARQVIEEPDRLRPQLADPPRPRQRGRVQQDAARPGERGGGSRVAGRRSFRPRGVLPVVRHRSSTLLAHRRYAAIDQPCATRTGFSIRRPPIRIVPRAQSAIAASSSAQAIVSRQPSPWSS